MKLLDQTVFVIDEGRVVETAIRNLDGYIDETTTPQGVGPRLHVRGTELWTWGPSGNNASFVSGHETEEAAIEALEETFYVDFSNACDLPYSWFHDRASADEYLADTHEQ